MRLNDGLLESGEPFGLELGDQIRIERLFDVAPRSTPETVGNSVHLFVVVTVLAAILRRDRFIGALKAACSAS